MGETYRERLVSVCLVESIASLSNFPHFTSLHCMWRWFFSSMWWLKQGIKWTFLVLQHALHTQSLIIYLFITFGKKTDKYIECNCALTSEVYGYVLLWRPLLRLDHHFRDPSFYTSVSVLMPSIFHFLKKSAFLGPFLSDFGEISALNTLILDKICSQDLFYF